MKILPIFLMLMAIYLSFSEKIYSFNSVSSAKSLGGLISYDNLCLNSLQARQLATYLEVFQGKKSLYQVFGDFEWQDFTREPSTSQSLIFKDCIMIFKDQLEKFKTLISTKQEKIEQLIPHSEIKELVLQLNNQLNRQNQEGATQREKVQYILDGVFEQNSLKSPQTLLQCLSDISIRMIYGFICPEINKLANGSINDFLDVPQDISDLSNQIPDNEKQCVQRNPEIKILAAEYGIDEHTDLHSLGLKIFAYITLHFLTVHTWFIDLNNSCESESYKQLGRKLASYLHQIVTRISCRPSKTFDFVYNVIKAVF